MQSKPDPTKITRISVEIPTELHKRAKIQLLKATEKRFFKVLVEDIIREWVEKMEAKENS